MIVLLFPAYSYAAYKIYLQNGSVISGASSYQEREGEIEVFFSTGSMTIPAKDVLRIEGKEEPAVETTPEEKAETPRKKEAEEGTVPDAASQPADDKTAKANALKAEIDSINSEIRSTEEKEAQLVSAINEKAGSSRQYYNTIQFKQLEKELEPMKQELRDVQQKKQELLQKRNALVEEFKSLE
jgi:predicted  nucleic acid-binding Zn-ribbon protein